MATTAERVLGDLSTPESFYETQKAERDCWETYLEYFEILDHKKPPQLAADCFTTDTYVAYAMKGNPLEFNGRTEYAAFLEKSVATQEMAVHIVGQHFFKWVDGTPTLRTNVMSWQWYAANAQAGELRPADFVTIGHAVDEFRNVDGKWLISKRVVAPAAGLTAIGTPPVF